MASSDVQITPTPSACLSVPFFNEVGNNFDDLLVEK